ncbi:MAG TPA: quinone-dependent dihydroorotate dehydrogenase [Bacteroidia bacterium]|jgi:dihydroorotate dehydrogenase|nr:quinone-dependent dihydroorotate dehydrogenase [Bacteroidia bacterium]
MYKVLIRPFLFLFSPEVSHRMTIGLLKFICAIPIVNSIIKSMHTLSHPLLETEVAGLKFPNPVGLAAGFDKNATFFHEMEYLGFGFVEVGTVTPLAQPGNPKPRSFRLPTDKGLINRMGFNNDGMQKVAERLNKRKDKIVIGGNIGKNKVTPNEDAYSDYEKCFDALFEYVDYFVVNVSSPNTPGLRSLQDKEPLMKILNGLQAKNKAHTKSKPIFLKIAPDLTNEQLNDIVEIVNGCGISGVVATNTTLSREGLKSTNVEAIGAGGLSGLPLRKRANEVIKYLHEKSNGTFPIIASGGIHSPADALEKLDAGAVMIELYTGFIYEGPMLPKRINREILRRRQQKQN